MKDHRASWTRRAVLRHAGTLAAATLLPARLVRANDMPRFKADPFSLGVASGYPSPASVVLWTRLAPEPLHPTGGLATNEALAVTCEIASDAQMRKIVRRERLYTSAQHAHSIHYEPDGLAPGREYWYRFSCGRFRSAIGRTRTAPAPNASQTQLKLAVASCQQFEHGYFHAYRHMVADDLDAIIHVGDYIYESSWGEEKVRAHGAPETMTLEDYRVRHALYRSDPDLQAAHAQYPWLVTWDDHEVENDYVGDLSQYDDPRAWFLARRAAAYQAYYEHMPLPRRALPFGADLRLYTRRAFGDLVNVFMLDSRQYRSPLPCTRPFWRGARRVSCDEIDQPERTKLGAIQESWLEVQLARSNATWNLLAQGTLMAHIREGAAGNEYWSDNWNGYRAARQRLMTTLEATKARNPLVLSGDIHAFLVANLHRTPADADSPVVASEFVTTSISSQGSPQSVWDAARARNPNVLHANSGERGYLRLHVTRAHARADLIALDSPSDADAPAHVQASFVVAAGRAGPQPL